MAAHGFAISREPLHRVRGACRSSYEDEVGIAVVDDEMVDERPRGAAVVDADVVEGVAPPSGCHCHHRDAARQGLDIRLAQAAREDDESVHLSRDGEGELATRPPASGGDQERVAGGGGGAFGAADDLVEVERRTPPRRRVTGRGRGTELPTIPDRRVASPRAWPSGTQPSSAATSRTRSRVAVDIPVPSRIARETVAVDTPLRRATS